MASIWSGIEKTLTEQESGDYLIGTWKGPTNVLQRPWSPQHQK